MAEALVQDGITQRPLAIPLSVITKASSGKDISHSIKRGKLANLASGIKNAPIVIVNPSRNAIVYVTSIKQSGAPILAAFDMDTVFDGDEVHKATSIHLQINVQSMLDNLPQNATVYVQNENELAAVGATNNLRGLAANVKFISSASIAKQGGDVKQKYSRELETVEELKKQNELLKKQVDYWHSQTAVTVGERGADKEEVKKLARQLKRDYGSQTEVDDYLQALQWLADNRQNKKAKFADMMKM